MNESIFQLTPLRMIGDILYLRAYPTDLSHLYLGEAPWSLEVIQSLEVLWSVMFTVQEMANFVAWYWQGLDARQRELQNEWLVEILLSLPHFPGVTLELNEKGN